MNFSSSFRNEELTRQWLAKIHSIRTGPVKIMEVCGGHTMAIRKYGLHTLLPDHVKLLSGPGCPVCVTDQKFIDTAVAIARIPDTLLLTYGDMLRVPGSFSSLEKERARGCDIRIIHSTLQALQMCRENPDKKVVFAAIGFETTTPATALAVLQAEKENIDNFFIICAHKTMPEAMETLVREVIDIQGYIGPGHVSAVTGSRLFAPLSEKYALPVVISGFEPLDLLQSVFFLLEMISQGNSGVRIQYRRLVSVEGNLRAQQIVSRVFEPSDEYWRGIGIIPKSGLQLKPAYSRFDATRIFKVKTESAPEPKGCICGSIMKGLATPEACKLFGRTCLPENPVGACMVSSEGACNAYYRYRPV